MFYKAPAVVPWDGVTMSDVVANVRVHPELAVPVSLLLCQQSATRNHE